MITVENMNKIIEEMRSIYKFNDTNSYIGLTRDFESLEEGVVTIYAKDERTGITIEMVKNGKKVVNEE